MNSDHSEMTPTTTAAAERQRGESSAGFAVRVVREETERRMRREIADRLRSQPWMNALPIADAIEKDEWDV